jgi:hypothetical protein
MRDGSFLVRACDSLYTEASWGLLFGTGFRTLIRLRSSWLTHHVVKICIGS